MSGFADLVAQAQPALVGGGCSARVTAGRTWSYTFTGVVDTAGAAIDLSTGITGTCKVWDAASVSTIVTTLTFTGASGSFTISLPKASTVGLGSGTRSGRKCRWGLILDNGTVSVQVWGPENSLITIYDEVAV